MNRAPFHFASYEPRFVLEDHTIASLHHAVALWQRMTFRPGPVTFAAVYPTMLLLRSGEHPGPFHPWQPVEIALADVPAYVAAWLHSATVDEPMPNFDGGETLGYSAFWGYFRGEEVDHSYGALVITTKWFEIHK